MVILYCGRSSVGKVVNPKVAVMDHNGDDGEKIQYFVFYQVFLDIFGKQHQKRGGQNAGNDHV